MFDILIRNGTVIDGSGEAAVVADVGIKGDRLVIGEQLIGRSAKQVIDADGLCVAPGFIDVHTHDDNALLVDPHMEAKTSQGVTTVVAGNCGISLAPLVSDTPPAPLSLLNSGDEAAFRFDTFAQYVAALRSAPAAVNAALLVGHSAVRARVMDTLDRAATPSEVAAMAELVDEAMSNGAIGLSTGLWYPPARHATMDEVVGVLEPVNRHGGIYTTHIRDEADGIALALDESFETARRAGTPLILSHHKCMGKANFGRSAETLKMIDHACAAQEVTFDAYPYTAGSSALLLESLATSSRVTITWSDAMPECAGRDLDELASEWSVSREEAAQRVMPGGAIYHMMSEEDVERILSHPSCMIGSDGLPHDKFPHPRLWGTFPRFLSHYVRDRQLASIEDAIRRITSLPADRFGLEGRGRIRTGAFADLVLFDPAEIEATASFEAPTQRARGIHTVVINGEIVCQEGRSTARRPGRVLTRSASNQAACQ